MTINNVKAYRDALAPDNALVDLCDYTISLSDKLQAVKKIIHREPVSGKRYEDECMERYAEIAILLSEENEKGGESEETEN